MRLEPGSAAALFSPQRLTQARQMLGVSRAELARRANLSAAAISQYESATTRPRATTLAELALVLNVPLEFLTTSRTDVPLPTVDTAFFRSLRRTTQKTANAPLPSRPARAARRRDRATRHPA